MPISKKRKKLEKKRAHDRDVRPAPPGAPAEPAGGGFLSKMRGGFKSAAGTGVKKQESLLSKILTWGLLLLVAYFVAKRFGVIR
ncbi:MAG: hypothetical protein E6J78_18585 [Deltaproteobacteria bacterium]|nr:MAG: hypothetical protein E6J78_18585 [Deltaproteobacteria bacterium]